MKTIKTYSSYNNRRYSKPWAAKVTLDDQKRMKMNFCGLYTAKDGDAGDLKIDAQNGELIAFGQKDGRGNKTKITYAIFENDSLKILEKTEAYKILGV